MLMDKGAALSWVNHLQLDAGFDECRTGRLQKVLSTGETLSASDNWTKPIRIYRCRKIGQWRYDVPRFTT